MDMEWAKDGVDGKIYIVQARPETVASQRKATMLESYSLDGRGEVLVEGRAVGEKIATGTRPADRQRRPTCTSSSPARCWSPTPPRPTGSR